MADSNDERQRRYRRRRRNGLMIVRLEVDAVDTAQKLLARDFIRPSECDDVRAIEAALQAHGTIMLRDT